METSDKNSYKWPLILLVAGMILPLIITLVFYLVAYEILSDKSPIALGDIANWLQVLVALWMVAVTGLLALQIFEVREQTRIQRDKANSEAYRPLISPQMQSIRRFIRTSGIKEKLEELGQILDNTQTISVQLLLDKFRSDVDSVACKVQLPLLGRRACLEDIEALINEYNYLCRLILDKTIDERFATSMAMVNFHSTHRTLLPFLRLRRIASEKYASHFTTWIDTRPES